MGDGGTTASAIPRVGADWPYFLRCLGLEVVVVVVVDVVDVVDVDVVEVDALVVDVVLEAAMRAATAARTSGRVA